MNEVKIATKIQPGRAARLSVKVNVEELGLDWKAQDTIRVMSYKEDNSIILKRVGSKASKTVAHTLTKTGGGSFEHDLGVFITHRPTRFRSEFKPSVTAVAGARVLGKNMLQVYMPREVFVA